MGIIKNIIQSTDKLALMESLSRLKTDLQQLGPIPTGKDIYDYGVKFFNIIATFQDNNTVDLDLFKNATDETKLLAILVKDAGRQEHGWGRVKWGEPVTLHNLYLGNLMTKPAVFWKEQSDKCVQDTMQK